MNFIDTLNRSATDRALVKLLLDEKREGHIVSEAASHSFSIALAAQRGGFEGIFASNQIANPEYAFNVVRCGGVLVNAIKQVEKVFLVNVTKRVEKVFKGHCLSHVVLYLST